MQKIVIIITLLLFSSCPAPAAIYRCSSNGKTLYSDRPCSTNGDGMSVIDIPPGKSANNLQDPTPATTETNKRINLRFRYEIVDNDISSKEKEIAEAVSFTRQLEEEHRETLAGLQNELNRIYRNNTYGRYRAHQVRQKIQAENTSFTNRMALARNRLNSLYQDLGQLKDERYQLKEQIRAMD